MAEDKTFGELPRNTEAEASLLGMIIGRNDALWDVSQIISKTDFFEPGHGELFILMVDQIERGRPVTPMTLLHDMTQDADIGGIRSSVYLRQITDQAPPYSQVIAVELAKVIRDLSLRRLTIELNQRMLRDMFSAPVSTPAEELRARWENELTALYRSTRDLGLRHIAEVGDQVLREVDRVSRSAEQVGMPLGLASIEDLTGPLMPGRVYVLAGASSAGKSRLAQQIGMFVARGEAEPPRTVVYRSIEMPDDEVAIRGMAERSGVPSDRIERALGIDAEEYGRLHEANEATRASRFYIDATTRPTVAEIEGQAARKKRMGGLHLLIIDHILYLAPPSVAMKEFEAIRANCQAIKGMAKRLGIAVILLAQFKSEYMAEAYSPLKGVRRPTVADVYNGQTIFQESDVFFFVHRPEPIVMAHEPEEGSKDRAQWETHRELYRARVEFILSKRRGGKQYGLRRAFWDDKTVTFTDRDTAVWKGDELPF